MKSYLFSTSYLYPFGSEMPNRSFSSGSYRYGFNGQEKDLEINEGGNSMTAEFWQYDGRTARRWNIDPIVKPEFSSYGAFGNNPIYFNDPYGDDWFKDTDGNVVWNKSTEQTYTDDKGVVYDNIGKSYHYNQQNVDGSSTTYVYGNSNKVAYLSHNGGPSIATSNYNPEEFGQSSDYTPEPSVEDITPDYFLGKPYVQNQEDYEKLMQILDGESRALKIAALQAWNNGEPITYTNAEIYYGYTKLQMMAAGSYIENGVGLASASFSGGGSRNRHVGKTYSNKPQLSVSKSDEGFDSFKAFKKANGPAGEGKAWHHIVEQNPSNIVKFGGQRIHNTNNLIKLPDGKGTIHAKVSGHYSSKQPFTGGKTVRQWLNSKSYEFQYNYGMQKLRDFGYK